MAYDPRNHAVTRRDGLAAAALCAMLLASLAAVGRTPPRHDLAMANLHMAQHLDAAPATPRCS